MLAANVGAMLLAFIGLIALINGILGGIGGWVGFEWLSLELILGWLFAPLAFLLGVPWEEATLAGSFIGQKLVVNEFVAYVDLGTKAAMFTSPRSAIIASYALCGFANISSIGIQLGGIGGIAHDRRHDLARVAPRAMVAGALASFMTATIAGFFGLHSGMSPRASSSETRVRERRRIHRRSCAVRESPC